MHQKLETGSIAYALDLAGWALRICSVVKYIEALTLSDWAFAHKAPPTGCLFFSAVMTGSRVAGFWNVRLVVHQKLEASSIAYALDLDGWALRICRW